MHHRMEILEQKSREELRNFFSSIPKHTRELQLVGRFRFNWFKTNHIANAFHFLPKYVSSVLFEIEAIPYNAPVIEDHLQYLVASLPSTIKKVCFHIPEFNHKAPSNFAKFGEILKSLPNTVVQLNLKL